MHKYLMDTIEGNLFMFIHVTIKKMNYLEYYLFLVLEPQNLLITVEMK